MNDEQLQSQYYLYRDLEDSYARARDAISNQGLDFLQNLELFDFYISTCEAALTKAKGAGYEYLSTFVTKMQKDIQTMKKYRDYVRDANQSYKNLYVTLDNEATRMRDNKNYYKDCYNEGKNFLERIW